MTKLPQILIISLCLSFSSIPALGNNLEEMNGYSFSFSELAGKWVFINYWATWCQYCLDEIPEFNRFYEFQKKNNIQVFAVNYDALPVAKQRALIKQFNIRYPSLKYDPASTLQLGDIRGLPVTYVFNPEGMLYTILYGGQTYHRLTKLLVKLKATPHPITPSIARGLPEVVQSL